MRLLNFLASNIPLFSAALVVLFIAFRNLRVRKRESIYFITFTTIVLICAFIIFLEDFAKEKGYVTLGTISSFFEFILRPILLYVFVLLANMEQKRPKKFYIALFIPLALNFLVYLPALFIGVPGLSTFIFSYQLNSAGGADLVRGSFLAYFVYLVCAFYLAILSYISMMKFRGKHRQDGLVIVLCVVVIISAVVVEFVSKRNDLLNIVCEICAMINYIFIITVNASKDSLTDLYDRRTFEEDVSKYKDVINGIIQIDMNELKFLNDHYGHNAGDMALNEIASILKDSSNESLMCVYRLSGDEFIVLMFQGKEIILEDTVKLIRERMNKTDYTIALGSYYFDPTRISFEDAMKQSEQFMYIDKGNYYKISGHNRRYN